MIYGKVYEPTTTNRQCYVYRAIKNDRVIAGHTLTAHAEGCLQNVGLSSTIWKTGGLDSQDELILTVKVMEKECKSFER